MGDTEQPQLKAYRRAGEIRDRVLKEFEDNHFVLGLNKNSPILEANLGSRSWREDAEKEVPAVPAAVPEKEEKENDLRLFSGQMQWLRDKLATQTKVRYFPAMNQGLTLESVADMIYLAVALPGFVAREIRPWSLDQLAENLLGRRSLARHCGVSRAAIGVKNLVRTAAEPDPESPLLAGGRGNTSGCLGSCCDDDKTRVAFSKLFLLLHFIRNTMPRREAALYANSRAELISSYDAKRRNRRGGFVLRGGGPPLHSVHT